MSRTLTMLLALTFTLGLAAVSSAGGVPSPTNSTVDQCLIVCPNGDFVFRVTVRDVAGFPVAGSFVTVDLCAAPTVHFCPGGTCQLGGVTDANGEIAFSIQAGGVTTNPIPVVASGVFLANRVVASPDQNGDLVVDAADLAIANGRLGMVDRTVDLDCDQGLVDAADILVLQAHLGHMCGGVTPTRPSTWGRVKTLYR